MDTSQFPGFDQPFEGVSGASSMVSVADLSNLDGLDRSTDPLSQSANDDPVAAEITVASHQRGDSHESSDNDFQADSPSMGNSLDDAGADDFGFSGQGKERADGTDLGGRPKDGKSDAPPAWSELKTKAGKERKRLPLACIACRRKKIRCSGEKPACKHCLRSRIPCVYKVTTRKAAPRTDYMAMLDKRLKRMEERIIKIAPRSDEDQGVGSIPRAVLKPSIPGTVQHGKQSSKKRSADDAFGPDLEAWAKAPSKLTVADDHQKASLQAQEAEETQLFSEGADALPSNQIQEHLAEVFFDNIYGQAYHLLHKPSYMRKLRSNSLPPVLVLSVCAIAARFATNPKLDTSTRHFLRGEEWASLARDICIRRYEWPNITILTCLLILGLHEFGTCQGGRSWAFGGQAIRMAFALQLHKDLEYDPLGRNGKHQLSFVDREIRRRVMWACFLMDRFNSSGTDRPLFIREEAINIPLPVKEKNFQLDIPAPTETLGGRKPRSSLESDDPAVKTQNNMGVAAYTIRSIALYGRIITYLNQGGKDDDPHPMWSAESVYVKLAKSAEQLINDLPSWLQYSDENLHVHRAENIASQFLLLHISLQQNLLFLHRAALSSSQQGPGHGASESFFKQAVSKTYAAANRVSDIIRDSEEAQCMVTAPFAGYCAFSASTVHILGIFSDDAQLKATAEANAGVNIKFLRKMMKYWGLFHWMVENIRSQYRAALDAARTGTPAMDSNAVSSILQYGDWFDRYPHGVSNAEFMDPATSKDKEKGADGVLEQKPELQSVEDFFEMISPTQSAGDADGTRAVAKAKRGNTSKKSTSSATKVNQQQQQQQQQQQKQPDVSASRRPPKLKEEQQQQNSRFQGAPQGQTSAPVNMNAIAMAQAQAQNAQFQSLTPISPVPMNQLSQNARGQQVFFQPNLLSMNLAHQSTGIMQPLDRQLVFGGYSTDPGNISGMQNVTNGMEVWDGPAANAQNSDNMRDVKVGMPSSYQQAAEAGQYMSAPVNNYNGEQASSAWFMPFNMEPPAEINQDMGWGTSAADSLGGVFSSSGDMTSPHQLGGLGQGGH